MDKKKIVIVGGILILVILSITFVFNGINKTKKTNTIIENNIAKTDVIVEEIEFKEITKVFKNGVTTIGAKMYNKTEETKNVTIKITLKDEKGKELKNMMQVVENLEPGKVKILSTGLAGDYTNVKDIKFEVVN